LVFAEYSNKFFGEGKRCLDSDPFLEWPVSLRGDSDISISGSKGLMPAASSCGMARKDIFRLGLKAGNE
jgi:hypothetical protein